MYNLCCEDYALEDSIYYLEALLENEQIDINPSLISTVKNKIKEINAVANNELDTEAKTDKAFNGAILGMYFLINVIKNMNNMRNSSFTANIKYMAYVTGLTIFLGLLLNIINKICNRFRKSNPISDRQVKLNKLLKLITDNEETLKKICSDKDKEKIEQIKSELNENLHTFRREITNKRIDYHPFEKKNFRLNDPNYDKYSKVNLSYNIKTS